MCSYLVFVFLRSSKGEPTIIGCDNRKEPFRTKPCWFSQQDLCTNLIGVEEEEIESRAAGRIARGRRGTGTEVGEACWVLFNRSRLSDSDIGMLLSKPLVRPTSTSRERGRRSMLILLKKKAFWWHWRTQWRLKLYLRNICNLFSFFIPKFIFCLQYTSELCIISIE